MSARQWRIGVDPIKCSGRGLCAELLPELVVMDDWGYPMVAETPFHRNLLRHARRAVAACPELALYIEPVSATEQAGRAPGRRIRPRGLQLARRSQFAPARGLGGVAGTPEPSPNRLSRAARGRSGRPGTDRIRARQSG